MSHVVIPAFKIGLALAAAFLMGAPHAKAGDYPAPQVHD
jgi:hypothetical protein